MSNLSKMTKAELLNEAKSLGKRASELEAQVNELEHTISSLQESNLFLRAIIENIPYEIWACDASGRYAVQNALDMSFWGNATGKSVDELVDWPEEIRTQWKKEISGHLMVNKFVKMVKGL